MDRARPKSLVKTQVSEGDLGLLACRSLGVELSVVVTKALAAVWF